MADLHILLSVPIVGSFCECEYCRCWHEVVPDFSSLTFGPFCTVLEFLSKQSQTNFCHSFYDAELPLLSSLELNTAISCSVAGFYTVWRTIDALHGWITVWRGGTCQEMNWFIAIAHDLGVCFATNSPRSMQTIMDMVGLVNISSSTSLVSFLHNEPDLEHWRDRQRARKGFTCSQHNREWDQALTWEKHLLKQASVFENHPCLRT